MQTSQVTIKDLLVNLVKTANSWFPNIEISTEIVTIKNMSVCRLTHRKLVGDLSWLTVINLTTRWKSEMGDLEVRVSSLSDVIADYLESVRHAVDIGLFEAADTSVSLKHLHLGIEA